jgi:hypothetical protein
VKYAMKVLRPFPYLTLWMSKRHSVTLQQIITVYNVMFNYIDSVMRAFLKKKNESKNDLFFTEKLTRQ